MSQITLRMAHKCVRSLLPWLALVLCSVSIAVALSGLAECTQLALQAAGNSPQALTPQCMQEAGPGHALAGVDPRSQGFSALLVRSSCVVLNDGSLCLGTQRHRQHIPLGGHVRDVLDQELQ